ncbi:hypothetical protein DSECCO2_340070 [anaerobic digester metagenome]
MKFDEDRVAKLSSEVMKALEGLREISDISKEEFLRKHHLVAGAKYYLIVSIEAVIDLSNHIISQNNLRIPESYSDTFKVMSETGIVPLNLTERLIEMAKFRNRLVHIYWEVDDELVYNIIKEDISDIEEFLQSFMVSLKS